MQLEYEKKQLLTENQFTYLLNLLKKTTNPIAKFQINYYFDDDNFSLYKQGVTLRIRQKDSGLQLERKYGKQYFGSTRVCNEQSKKIDQFCNSINMENKTYTYKGNLVTNRTNFCIAGELISLDANYYLGKKDYEIEIEGTGEVIVPELIKEAVSFEYKPDGKYSRFVKTLSDIAVKQLAI